jgi:hypothetical protein
LAKGAPSFGFIGEVWTTKRIAAIIQELFGVSYHPAHVSRLVRALGHSVQLPVTQATQRDEAALATWYDERWPDLNKRPNRRTRMRSKFGFGVLVALLVVAGGIGASVLSAAPSSTRTRTVVIKEREAKVVDLAPAGPSHGDLRVVNGPLYNAQGTQVIGAFDHVCTVTDPADEPREPGHIAQCLTTYRLPEGDLTAQGVLTYPVLTEKISLEGPRAITGGTGQYQTARGETVARSEGEQTIITFQLILAP